MEIGLIVSVFIAGLLTFFMPCTFPLVPAFIAFVSGPDAKDHRKTVLLNVLFFILGFTAIFVFFGSALGLIGQSLGEYKLLLRKVGGLVIMIFGLFILNIYTPIFFQNSKSLVKFENQKSGKIGSSFLLGLSLGLGWTPCIGPILGSVLLLATSSTSVISGMFLLTIFSVGLAIPFFIVAILGVEIIKKINKYKNFLRGLNIFAGLLLILIGFLQFTDNMGWLFRLVSRIERHGFFEFLLNYM
jgi:cytochrome c-type biogenesis protein